MDELVTIERTRNLRQEISEIKAANRIYWECHQHTQAEKNDNERRRERLQEIKSELPIPWAMKAFLACVVRGTCEKQSGAGRLVLNGLRNARMC
jgi:hypothetical protein